MTPKASNSEQHKYSDNEITINHRWMLAIRIQPIFVRIVFHANYF